ncbi:nucleotide phosphatase [Lithospermum erythrorhizon]|uniref:Nucleotide phosphatase n=1 Tax=Lithospermum erythrorhizon TaxID=34254 RepID=A0AAV3QVR8_LITER
MENSKVHAQVLLGTEYNEQLVLDGKDDLYGGLMVEINQPMDSNQFANRLTSSIIKWRQQGKKGIWIKLTIQYANLVESAVKKGFWYHHAEATYLMLVYWIPQTPNTLPVNASHRVGIGALLINDHGEVLVVQEKSGKFKGTGVWKLPTGVVNEREDLCIASIREVKEETGIDSEFVEILGFRQSHNSFFGKSDLFFLCMLKPLSFSVEKQDSEIEAVQWMKMEEYAAQPFVVENEIFNSIAKICLAKKNNDYAGFSAVLNTSGFSSKKSYLYFNSHNLSL